MIVFSRIDDKLIHGQVATTWIRVSGANRIYIVDDTTANDKFISRLYKATAPQGTKVDIWDLNTGFEKVKLVEKHEQIKGFILCRSPLEFLAMAKSGINFKELNVGNMSAQGDREQLQIGINTFANAKERDAFRELVEMGVDVYLHMIPDKPKIPILECTGMKKENN